MKDPRSSHQSILKTLKRFPIQRQLKYEVKLTMDVADAMKLPTKHQKRTGILRTQRQDTYVYFSINFPDNIHVQESNLKLTASFVRIFKMHCSIRNVVYEAVLYGSFLPS